MLNKDIIRKRMLEERNAVAPYMLEKCSEAIFSRLFSLQTYKDAKVIMTYISFGREVKTALYLNRFIKDEKRLSVPFIASADIGSERMEAVEVKDPETSLIPGPLGILSPSSGLKDMIDPMLLDLIIIPGLAFDMQMNRIGFGKGYYDRFLSRINKRCCKIGLAMDFQIMEKVPFTVQDIQMDMIITEKNIYYNIS